MAVMNRRGFMVGCSTAIAAMAGSRMTYALAPDADAVDEILLVVFLRGGIDGLSVVPVIDGADRALYEEARPRIGIPTSGSGAAIPIADQFGLHPSMAPLYEMYQDQQLAVIVAAGQEESSRSHFDMMNYMELGSPSNNLATSGWLTRHLLSTSSVPDDAMMPAIATGTLQPTSFLGSREAMSMYSPASVKFTFHWRYKSWLRYTLREMYGGNDSSWLHQAGLQTVDAVDVVEYANPTAYTPSNGAAYPEEEFGNNLKSIAQMIKMNVGLSVATVDYGGWDTHEYQGDDGGGYIGTNIDNLARGLNAFYTDLDTLSRRSGGTGANVTTIIMSEFGRSLKQNGSRGTDHGHGNVMFVLGSSVNGGQIYGEWPGLSTEQLYDSRDLAITTDYRRVLSEVLIRRFQNPNLGYVFPHYADYEPLGLMKGNDIEPVYASEPEIPDSRLDDPGKDPDNPIPDPVGENPDNPADPENPTTPGDPSDPIDEQPNNPQPPEGRQDLFLPFVAK